MRRTAALVLAAEQRRPLLLADDLNDLGVRDHVGLLLTPGRRTRLVLPRPIWC